MAPDRAGVAAARFPVGSCLSPTPTQWIPFAEIFATVFSIAAAALIIVWQVGAQHTTALAQDQAAKAAELKLQLFEKLHEKMRAVSEGSGAAGTYARLVLPSLIIYRHQLGSGITPSSPSQSPMEFNEKHTAMGMAVGDLLIALEEHEIVLRDGLKIFRLALNSAVYNASQASQPLFRNLMARLPLVDPTRARPTVWPAAPTDGQMDETQKLVNAYADAADEVQCYVSDLSVACQNELLGDLFPGRFATNRKPLDPRLKVVTTNDAEEVGRLEEYFTQETPWGKHIQETEAAVRASINTGGHQQ